MDIVSWALGCPTYDQDKPIFIDALDPSNYVTASQARRLVRQLIAGFKANGLRRGDTVCILSLSNIYYPVFFLAVVGAGGRVAGGNPGHTVYELQQLLSKCSVRYIVTESAFVDKATSAAGECGIKANHTFLLDRNDAPAGSQVQNRHQLLSHGECDWDVLDEAQAAKTISAYYSTSGTTGSPKFAAISHGYQVANGQYIESETGSKPYRVSRLVSLPLMHAFAAPLVHLAALRCGTPTFITSRFSVRGFVSTISKHAVTEFPVVPSMLIALVTSPQCTPQALNSVREVMCAGAPLSTSLAESFSTMLTAPGARLVQLYGATEAGWISSTPYRHPNNHPHSTALNTSVLTSDVVSLRKKTESAFPLHAVSTPTVGTPLPGYSMRLVHSSSGLPISGTNVPGSLQVRVTHPFMHYIDADQATRDSFTADGWLKTGDIATRDDAGRYYIVDREKDMIKVRGWQVAPAEIEAVLASHDMVNDCAVLGKEDTGGASGEVPWAFVTLKTQDNSNAAEPVSEATLKAWLRERLAGYKVPEAILIIEQIPRNPAGKTLRRVLRDQYMPKTSIPVPPPSLLPDSVSVPGALRTDKGLGEVLPTWTARGNGDVHKGDGDSRAWPRLATAHQPRHRSNVLVSVLAGLLGERFPSWMSGTALLPVGLTLGLGFYVWHGDLVNDLKRWLTR